NNFANNRLGNLTKVARCLLSTICRVLSTRRTPGASRRADNSWGSLFARPVSIEGLSKMIPTLRVTHPFSTLNRLDSLFDRFLSGDGEAQRAGSVWRSLPLSLWQDDKAVYLEAELPGVAENEVDITVHEGVLSIKAERKDTEGRAYLHNGRAFGRF